MSREIKREERPDLGAVIVTIEDNDGRRTPHTIYLLDLNKCPKCGRQNLLVHNTVDIEATITALIERIDHASDEWKKRVKPK